MGDALPLGNRLEPHAGAHTGGNKANVEKVHDRRYMEFLEVSNSYSLEPPRIQQLAHSFVAFLNLWLSERMVKYW